MVLDIFKKKPSKPIESINVDPKVEIKKIDEKPKLFLIDLESDITKKLRDKGLNASEGSLGKKIQIHYTPKTEIVQCLLNSNIPDNLHEFQIVILDLHDDELIEYDFKDHVRGKNSHDSEIVFICQPPQTIFNPKPICGQWFLRPHLDEIFKKQGILIIFSNSSYVQKYQLAKITNRGSNLDEQYSINNYNFTSEIPYFTNKFGKEMIVNENLAYTQLLKKYLPDSSYDITFRHPTIYRQDLRKEIPDPMFYPFIWNEQHEIVSFIRSSQSGGVIFLFPDIKDKSSFLVELLTEVLPSIFNEIFLNYSKYKWLEDSNYELPKENELSHQKNAVIHEFEEKITSIEKEIELNHQKYECLHRLLIDDGKKLVKDVENFFIWLGFENVKNMDELHPEKLDEDLQIELDSGLLIIEVKGIGGTSKDEECSQINKHVLRRQTERGKTDVHGLYIVNHQKHLPPLKRENPPFKENQITDAENDSRGLITTWQLFNLYFSIKSGAITKEEARVNFSNAGLIEFVPKNISPLGKPERVIKEGTVILFNISTRIQNTGELFIKRNERFYPVEICEIRKDDTKVECVDSGSVGIKINMIARTSDEIYYRS
jgi:hypothetical protein